MIMNFEFEYEDKWYCDVELFYSVESGVECIMSYLVFDENEEAVKLSDDDKITLVDFLNKHYDNELWNKYCKEVNYDNAYLQAMNRLDYIRSV